VRARKPVRLRVSAGAQTCSIARLPFITLAD
jgi:hypothetical protein